MQYIDKNGRLKIGETVIISGCIFLVRFDGTVFWGRRLHDGTPVHPYKATDKTHRTFYKAPGKPATIRAGLRSGAWRIA